MAIVSAFKIDGVRCWFWSSEHLPPHFHAQRRGEWEVKIMFMELPDRMIEIVRESQPIGAKHRKQLRSMAKQFREELLQQWESIHRQQQ